MLERYIKEWAISSDIKIETRIFPSAGGLPLWKVGGGKGLVADPAGYSDGGGRRRVPGSKISAERTEAADPL